MLTREYKLKDIAKIITGLPILRYTEKENITKQKVIGNKSIDDINQEFIMEEEKVTDDIKKHFYSQKHDILYKVQQRSFAKEITTEIGAIIPNTYIIIRVDPDKTNPTFLANYLNNPKVDYEITRQIDSTKIMKVNTSILKELTIILPEKNLQDNSAQLITKINQRIDLKKKSIESDEQLINSLYDEIIGDEYER
ncbi:MAG: hypothetical protein BZ135_00820 [Methanosphaera sp. rholeuAM6]|nr:MAG: hypothetical protein BZ135_00820 [Methanosphaera sp. rholeuAM6]